MIYLKVDLTHKQAQRAIGDIEGDFKTLLAENNLSVNAKQDGSVAWVKTVRDIDLTRFKDFVIRKEISNEAALAEIYADPNWYPQI